MDPVLTTDPSSGIPAGLRKKAKDAASGGTDMEPESWRGLIDGLMEFFAEEAAEPEHAEDMEFSFDAEFNESDHPRGKGGQFGSGGGGSSNGGHLDKPKTIGKTGIGSKLPFVNDFMQAHKSMGEQKAYLEKQPHEKLKHALGLIEKHGAIDPASRHVKQMIGQILGGNDAALAKDTAPKTLYVNRPLQNASDVIAWARGAGFKKTLVPDEMHVTVAYSKQPVDWDFVGAGEHKASLDVPDAETDMNGARSVEQLGDKGAVVLRFESPDLADRWSQFRAAGASWDYDEYRPHVTFTFDPGDIDLSKVEPYNGPLVFGPEMAAEIVPGDDWAGKAKAKMVGDEDVAPTAAGVRFVDPGSNVLLLKRSGKSDHPGEWAFPGGGIEPGETPEQCARREAAEETGRVPGDGMAIGDRSASGGLFHTFTENVGEQFEPELNDEHTEHVWASPDALPQPLHPGVANYFAAIGKDEADMKFPLDPAGLDAEFNESDHPREKGGKFGSGGGGGGPETGEAAEKREKETAAFRAGQEAEAKSPRAKKMAALAKGTDHYDKLADEAKEKGDDAAAKKYYAAARAYGAAYSELSRAKGKDGAAVATDSALKIALDRGSVREIDKDGRMRVEVSNISKATVNPYVGHEIPQCEELGLDPNKVYRLLRDPAELKKAASTFNGVQLLKKHSPVSADDHKPYDIVGTTGSEAEFESPYLRNSLFVWTNEGIDLIESNAQKEISCGYYYRADMTPGEFEGMPYEGVMRDIVGNHVALVETGRAGADVVVGDSAVNVGWAIVEAAIMGLAADA